MFVKPRNTPVRKINPSGECVAAELAYGAAPTKARASVVATVEEGGSPRLLTRAQSACSVSGATGTSLAESPFACARRVFPRARGWMVNESPCRGRAAGPPSRADARRPSTLACAQWPVAWTVSEQTALAIPCGAPMRRAGMRRAPALFHVQQVPHWQRAHSHVRAECSPPARGRWLTRVATPRPSADPPSRALMAKPTRMCAQSPAHEGEWWTGGRARLPIARVDDSHDDRRPRPLLSGPSHERRAGLLVCCAPRAERLRCFTCNR
jgi:hypothetical protein